MIAMMDDPNDRPAPGALWLVQQFLNAPTEELTADELQLGDEIRRLAAVGESQAGIAARFGVSQQMVSAALRERRLIGPAGQSLATPATTKAWLGGLGFPVAAVSSADHLRMRRLGGALHQMALANNGEPLDPSAIVGLQAAMAEARFTLRSGPDGELALEPGSSGASLFIETVLTAVYEAQGDGTWIRLKACPADRCQHVFYDTSRNRTASWCSMAICGNRAKVRAYQERRRQPVRS